MQNARRVCLGSTAIPLHLLPVLIAMRGISVVKALRAANHVLHILLQLREAQLACVMRALVVMVLRAANHVLHILLQLREVHPACVMRASAATVCQLV